MNIFKKVPSIDEVYRQVDKSIARDRREWAQQERDELMGKQEPLFRLPNIPNKFWDVFWPIFIVGAFITGIVLSVLNCKGVI